MPATGISPKQKYFSGIIIVMIALMIFLSGVSRKDLYRLHSERYTAGSHAIPFLAEKDTAYNASVWAVDEESGEQQWATLSCEAEIRDSKGKLVNSGEVVATESKETGGVRRARRGFELYVQSMNEEELLLKVHLLEGDFVDVELRKEMPVLIRLLPSLGILIGFAGAMLITKGRIGMGQPH
jgi:hypothetical protein